MKQRVLVRIAAGAWLVGLICFVFPFLVIPGVFVEDTSLNALSLMTKITGDGKMSGEAPVNWYLWVAFAAGVVGFVCMEHILGAFYESWELARESKRPVVAVIGGAVGIFCLFLFQEAYSKGLDGLLGKFTLPNGWGRNLALFCFIAAECCVLGAYAWDIFGTDRETDGAPSGLIGQVLQSKESLMRPVKSETLVETKLAKLKQQYLTGVISAADYERELTLVQEIAKDLPKEEPVEKQNPTPPTQKVYFDGPRPDTVITCPKCGNTQRPDRLVCWECGAMFVFKDEEKKEEK